MSTKADSSGLNQIGQIAIIVHDLDRAVTFYRDVLGMNFLFEVPGMAFFQCGDIRLMLGLPEREEFDHPASILYYRVTDIDAAAEVLKKRDVHFEEEPRLVHKTDDNELWLSFFRDPDENVLALMCEKPVTA